MWKIPVWLVGVTILVMAYAAWAEAPATQPSTQRATGDIKESEAVRVNGLDFQIVAPVVWMMPVEKEETPIPLVLKVTNHTDKAVTLNLFDTITISMKDAAGKELRIDGGRDGTTPCPPLIVEKGQNGTVDRSAKLQPLDGKLGQFRLIGSDGAGGIWYFDGLKPGKYTISMAYENTKAGPEDAPNWVGKATTKELTVEITDKSAASQPAR